MLKGKRGVTLLELMVAMGLSSIILLVLLAVMGSVYVSNSTAATLSRAQSIAQITLVQLEQRLRYADAVDVDLTLPDPLNENHGYYYVSGGRLIEKSLGGAEMALGPLSGFEGFTCDASFSKVNAEIGDKVLEVSLAIYKGGDKIYSISQRIYVNNLTQGITGKSAGSVLTFQSSLRSPVLVHTVVATAPSPSITRHHQTMQMSALVYPSNATKRSVSWSVTPTELATITQEGLLTPLKNGVVTVKAAAMDGSGVSGSVQLIIQFSE